MSHKLIIIASPEADQVNYPGKEYTFTSMPVTIGRGAPNHIPLQDPGRTVSRVHAQIIEVEGGRWAIEDLQSKNFTFLNEMRLDSGEVRVLQPDDEITLGDFTIQFKMNPAIERLDPTNIATSIYDAPTIEIPNPFEDEVEALIQSVQRICMLYDGADADLRATQLAQALQDAMGDAKSHRVTQAIAHAFTDTELPASQSGQSIRHIRDKGER